MVVVLGALPGLGFALGSVAAALALLRELWMRSVSLGTAGPTTNCFTSYSSLLCSMCSMRAESYVHWRSKAAVLHEWPVVDVRCTARELTLGPCAPCAP